MSLKGFGRPSIGAIQTIRLTGNEGMLPDAEYAGGSFGDLNDDRSMYEGHRKVDVSRPYILIVQNGNSHLTEYVLFGSSQNRTSASFGNPSGISINYGLVGYTYTQLLCDTEARPFTLGRIRIELLDSNTANLTSPLTVTKTSSEGTIFQSPLTPYFALNQFITSAIEIPCDFEVDADTAIHGALVANSGIRVSFFPAHRVSSYRRELTPEQLAEIAYQKTRMYLLICEI